MIGDICPICKERRLTHFLSKYCKPCASTKQKAASKMCTLNKRGSDHGADGTITFEQWSAVCESFGMICLRCKRPGTVFTLTPDHVVPLSLGGSNTIENIQPLCMSCNCSKNAKVADYRVATH